MWRLSETSLTFQELRGRTDHERPSSLTFPWLMSADLLAFVSRLGQVDDTALALEFRQWVRQHLLAPSAPPAVP